MFNWLIWLWLMLVGYLAWRHDRFVLGLLAAALPTYLLRLKVGGIPTTWLELAIYVVALIWIYKIVFIPEYQGKRAIWWAPLSPYRIPLLLGAAGLLIGTLVSTEPTISLGIIKGWFIDSLLLFLLIINMNNQRSPRTTFYYVVAGLWVSGVILASVALGQVISGHYITVDQRASAWFSSANYLALYLVPVMIIILGLWRTRFNPHWLRWILGGSWLIMLAGLYFTFSYAGWLALLIGLIVWWGLSAPSLKTGWMWAVGLGAIILSQWQLPKFQQMLDLGGHSSSHVRLQVWQTALLMIKENWLTGIGLGLFEKRYLEFAARLFHPPLELIMLHSHNIFLQFWINTGILGLAGFFWLIGKWWQQIWPVIRSKQYEMIAIGAAMVATLTHGLLDVAYWKNDLSALFWIILALGIIFNQAYGREGLSDRN